MEYMHILAWFLKELSFKIILVSALIYKTSISQCTALSEDWLEARVISTCTDHVFSHPIINNYQPVFKIYGGL